MWRWTRMASPRQGARVPLTLQDTSICTASAASFPLSELVFKQVEQGAQVRAGRTRALIRRRTQRCSSGQYTRLYCRFTSWSFLFRLCENVTAGAAPLSAGPAALGRHGDTSTAGKPTHAPVKPLLALAPVSWHTRDAALGGKAVRCKSCSWHAQSWLARTVTNRLSTTQAAYPSQAVCKSHPALACMLGCCASRQGAGTPRPVQTPAKEPRTLHAQPKPPAAGAGRDAQTLQRRTQASARRRARAERRRRRFQRGHQGQRLGPGLGTFCLESLALVRR